MPFRSLVSSLLLCGVRGRAVSRQQSAIGVFRSGGLPIEAVKVFQNCGKNIFCILLIH